MFTKRDRNEIRRIRHERVRKKISGTPEMPRLCVYRSLNHIYTQVIDDTVGKTLVSCSTARLSPSARSRPASSRSSSTAAVMCIPAAWRRSPQAPVKRASTSDQGGYENASGI